MSPAAAGVATNYKLILSAPSNEQPSVDAVMEARRLAWIEREKRDRQLCANKWREGRRRLREYPEPVRKRLLDHWNNHRWLPGTYVYFLDMMDMHDNGKLDLN